VVLDDGTVLRSAHLSRVEVQDGQRVNAGDVIARSGGARGAPGSGNSRGPHVHYEVRNAEGQTVDPVEYHRGGARSGAPGTTRTGLQDQLQELYSLDLPRQQEQAAEQRIRSLHGAQQQARQDNQEAVRNRAYAEVARTGQVSNGLMASLTAAGLADNIPSLQSFAQSEQRRRTGGPGGLSEADSLPGYAIAREMIANRQITTVEQLYQLNDQLSDDDMRRLVDDLTNPSSRTSAAELTNRAQSLFTEEIEASGLFQDENGKETTETRREYANFRGAVYRQAQREAEAGGGAVSDERLREITFGLLANRRVAGGDDLRGYQFRPTYDAIPQADRLRAIRALQQQNIPRPTIRQVIEYHRQTN
jgi:hypothetical protein